MKNSMATKDAIPGNPATPEIRAVNTLIGMWMSYAFPMAFNKNRSRAPIQKRVTANPTSLNGLIGAPTNSRIKISVPKMAIIVTGSILTITSLNTHPFSY
jgi:hypothetical protein